jgi:hypothetical protein
LFQDFHIPEASYTNSTERKATDWVPKSEELRILAEENRSHRKIASGVILILASILVYHIVVSGIKINWDVVIALSALIVWIINIISKNCKSNINKLEKS